MTRMSSNRRDCPQTDLTMAAGCGVEPGSLLTPSGLFRFPCRSESSSRPLSFSAPTRRSSRMATRAFATIQRHRVFAATISFMTCF